MNPVYNIFVYAVWFLATYYIVFLLLFSLAGRNELYKKKRLGSYRPLVSLVVPAFNEEEKVKHTIASLKKVTYSKVEFIILSDGSTDGTAREVRDHIKGDPRFRFINNKKNKGKAATLNQGIALAKGEIIGCMDADSMIEPKILHKVIPYFDADDVGAVTVSVEVADTQRLLHKLFDIEYRIGLSLFLKTLSFCESIFVTPGPFTAFSKKALNNIGGFSTETLTEDLEIAYRLQKNHYKIRNCLEAKVKTFVPPTFKEIYVQRKRWYAGGIQTISLHRDMIFSRKYGTFGFIMPMNFIIIFTGMAVFLSSIWLTGSKMWSSIYSLRYTSFNILERLQLFELDFLRLGNVTLIGLTAFFATILMMFIGLSLTRTKFREKLIGMMLFPLLFFLYQLYWMSAIWSTIWRKKVEWR